MFLKRTDDVIWICHINSTPTLIGKLHAAVEGSLWCFEISGNRGLFEKMQRGSNLGSTPGFKPVGPTKLWWQETKGAARGAVVPFTVIGPVAI